MLRSLETAGVIKKVLIQFFLLYILTKKKKKMIEYNETEQGRKYWSKQVWCASLLQLDSSRSKLFWVLCLSHYFSLDEALVLSKS